MTGALDRLRHWVSGLIGLASRAAPAPEGYSEADGDRAAALAADPRVFLLDVRTKEEWDEGRLANAALIPVHELGARLSELPADLDRPILVYCAIGGRSARAGQLLVRSGRKRVINMAGGISLWRSQGRPVVS